MFTLLTCLYSDTPLCEKGMLCFVLSFILLNTGRCCLALVTSHYHKKSLKKLQFPALCAQYLPVQLSFINANQSKCCVHRIT